MAKILKCGFSRGIRFLYSKKLLTSLLVIALIFNLLVAASVAWLTLNRKTNADNMGMALAVDDTTAIYKAYMFDMINMQGTDMHPDGTPLNVTNIDLNQYDTIFNGLNKYTPAFSQINITRYQSMPESGTIFVTIHRNDLEKGNETPDLYYSSSVIRFTAFIDSTKQDLNITDAPTLFSYINTPERFSEISGYRGNDHPHSKTFVTDVGEGAQHTHEKSEEITLSVSYDPDDWYIDDEGNQTLNVYLYMSYDVQLIDCFVDEHRGGEISLEHNLYFFNNDFKKISVSYAK